MRQGLLWASERKLPASSGSELFQYLDVSDPTVGSLFTPVGFHPVLERAILPNEETIYHAAKELLLY
mgnify:CR=1 FL=1